MSFRAAPIPVLPVLTADHAAGAFLEWLRSPRFGRGKHPDQPRAVEQARNRPFSGIESRPEAGERDAKYKGLCGPCHGNYP
jgi:hypothetical protein